MTRISFKLGSRTIGPGNPVYIIAELSANHHQDFDQAVQLLEDLGRVAAS